MMRGFGYILGLLLIVTIPASMMLMSGCDEQTTGTVTTQIGGQWFTLETAISEAQRNQGLMGRTEVAADGGMIFVFDDDVERSFWMKNCLMDIDIVFVDRAGFVVSTAEMKKQPPKRADESEAAYDVRMRRTGSYPSGGRCRYVIELQPGRIRALGLKKGDKIPLDLEELKKLAATDDGR